MAFSLARRYPHCKVIAYETSPIPFWFAKFRRLFAGTPNLHLERKDFFHQPLQDADLLVCYLYPGAMRQLKAKFAEELKPGAIVISNTFSIPGWKAEHVREAGDIYYTKIYLYRI